jgi:D-alanyl-D-alanine carboxypeptidase/D-alanyl-D-alanine-endopeptidase (penicillin-binding protein 4)
VPHVDPARTAALAVDLRTGAVVYSRNPRSRSVPASNQKLPVAYAALAQLGPGYRFHTEVVGSGTLVGRRLARRPVAARLRRPDARPDDLDALAADVASWGSAASTAR